MLTNKRLLFYLLIFLLIILRISFSKTSFKEGDVVKITTRILSDPIKYETKQYVKIVGLKTYFPLVPEIKYGDYVTVVGSVQKGELTNSQLLEIKENKRSIFDIKNKIVTFYKSTLPEPYAGLLAGIVLGSKGSMSQTLWEKTKDVGLTHVVVASGTNISLVSSFLLSLFIIVLPRKKAILFVILGIILYLFVSGFDAPLIRATIMGSTLFMAQETGRIINGFRALVTSAVVMILVNPSWISDLGFILSFVSTLSLMIFEERIRQRLFKLPEFFREGLSTSLAAQIGVSPILFVTFGQFNILSPVINAFVLWTIPIIMVIGTIGGVLSLIFPILGKIIIYLSYPLLWFFNYIVILFSF